MIRRLDAEHAFSDRFVSYMLSRNIRIEEDLIDQLFNSSEKRLARTLLLLARYGKGPQPQKLLPKVSQETLAEMIGTSRSRVNFFMNKFRKLGSFDIMAASTSTVPSSVLSCTSKPTFTLIGNYRVSSQMATFFWCLSLIGAGGDTRQLTGGDGAW
jgi:Crp-like helix-turn-helix domain